MTTFYYQSRRFHISAFCFTTSFLLFFCGQLFSQERRGQKIEVTKSATVDFMTIEAYHKSHPTDPNERRIADKKVGETEQEEEELAPVFRVPRNAKIIQDPYGKMLPKESTSKTDPGNVPSALSPIIDFNAIDDVNSVIPPDIGGQVGPNHVMTTLNSYVRISSRTGTVLSTVSLNSFFSTLGNPNTFDPKVFYDPFAGRWVVVACGNAASASSSVLLGVSATNNPTGTWKLYSIDVDAANTNWFDYPSIGFNKDWVVVTGNMFTNTNFSFTGGKIYVFKKSDLYAAVVSPAVTVINAGTSGFTLCPAITYDNSISTLYLTQNYNGNSGGNGFIGLYSITGAVGSEVLSSVTFVSTPNPWASSATVTNFAPQAGTTNKVACNDARMQKTIYRNGKLWCTHTVFLPASSPTRSAVQWWQLSTAGSVLQRGRLDDGTGVNFYAFPSIDVNKNDDAMIGCAKFNSSIFPSACYAVRMASDSVNTFQADIVYKSGQASYFKTFSGTSNRWGDYTAVCVDPVNDMDLWTCQEYSRPPSGGSDFWGTWWTGVCFPPPTPGSISGVSPANAGATNQIFSVPPVSGASSYTWTFPAGCVITSGANTNSVTVTLGTTSGTVSVVANKGNCSSSAQTFSLTVITTPLGATVSNNGPLCPGGTLNLTCNPTGGIPPYSFTWTSSNGFASTIQNPTIANVTTSNSGQYNVEIKDATNTIVNKSTIVVVNPKPSVAVSPAGKITVCSNNTPVVLTCSTGGATPSFIWYKNGTAITPAETKSTLSVTSSGIYAVEVTAAGCTSGLSSGVEVNVNPASGSTLDTAVCGSFTWNGVTYTTSGTYRFKTTNTFGCDSIAVLNLVISKISATFTKADAICYATTTGTITINATGGVAPYRYRLGTTGSYQSSNTFNVKAGTYKVYILDTLGCSFITGSIVITQPVAVATSFTKTDASCYGSATGSLSITVNNGVPPYQYKLNSTGTYGSSGTFSNLIAGTYRVYVIDSKGCTATSAAIVIGQPAAVSATFTSTPAVCYGTATGSLTVNGINGVTPYQYRLGTTGSYSINNSFVNIKGGSYTVYIMDARGCVGTKVCVVAQPAAIVLTYTKVDITCTSPKGSITLIKSGGPSNLPYRYSLGSSGLYVSNNIFTNLSAGNYYGYIRDSLGCTARTSAIPLPAATNCFGAASMAKSDNSERTDQKLDVSILPNPSSESFTLFTHSGSTEPVYIRVLDINGRAIFETKGRINQALNFGSKFANGLYMVEVKQGKELKTIKAIKAN